MENYTRTPDSIRKSKTLNPTEKLILGYLYTYQIKIDGDKLISTKKYFYNTQEVLAEELGLPLRTLKSAISALKEKELIFQVKKGKIDGKNQYKNRKAIIMVDEFNPLPTEEPKQIKSEIIQPIEVIKETIQPEVIDEYKELVKERFDIEMKWAREDSHIAPAQINKLFDFQYNQMDIIFIKDVFTKNDFEKLYSTVINLTKSQKVA